MFQSHRDDVRQLYRNFAEDSMLGHNTSMKVVEESFRLELRYLYESVQSAIDLFSFWIVLPIGIYISITRPSHTQIFLTAVKKEKKSVE